ncbi:MAG: hypothetical protein JWQ38_522 [Flavipsychrobacter sp.]|nr:hypothetical protein [Flavipsychrobacter sp.]
MKKLFLSLLVLSTAVIANGQTSPVITSWLQNNSVTGTYYVSGSSTALSNSVLVNCQKVEYSTDWVYVHSKGVPSYPTGPFLDGNPSLTSDQNTIYKISRKPQANTSTATKTALGITGAFINGVAMFDCQDGKSWLTSTNNWGNGMPGAPAWRRDAVVFERAGFDCAKGHPAKGQYHHHQNPSAFNLDKVVLSTVCNLYAADGLYKIDPTKHSPLIGYALDGYPVYGAYAYKNVDGTGGIVRMQSSYQLRSITSRTALPDGTVLTGPPINTTYPLGTCIEDYEYVAHAGVSECLDEHNGRFCVTPEYLAGTYAYFATVDANYNSVYPYIIGPTYYGVTSSTTVTTVSESTTTYAPTGVAQVTMAANDVAIFPNPASDILAVQVGHLVTEDVVLNMVNIKGQVVQTVHINKGSTIAYFDLQTVYNGMYSISFTSGGQLMLAKQVIVNKN